MNLSSSPQITAKPFMHETLQTASLATRTTSIYAKLKY